MHTFNGSIVFQKLQIPFLKRVPRVDIVVTY